MNAFSVNLTKRHREITAGQRLLGCYWKSLDWIVNRQIDPWLFHPCSSPRRPLSSFTFISFIPPAPCAPYRTPHIIANHIRLLEHLPESSLSCFHSDWNEFQKTVEWDDSISTSGLPGRFLAEVQLSLSTHVSASTFSPVVFFPCVLFDSSLFPSWCYITTLCLFAGCQGPSSKYSSGIMQRLSRNRGEIKINIGKRSRKLKTPDLNVQALQCGSPNSWVKLRR